MTDYGMIEPNAPFRASSRSHPHTMRRASLRTQSTDTRSSQQQQAQSQQQQMGSAGVSLFPPVPPPPPPMTSSLSSNPIRRARPRSFSFDEQLSIIDDDDESLVHDMPFTVAPVRPSQPNHHHHHHPHPHATQGGQHRRLNTSKVSSRCRGRRRRSRSLTKRTAAVPIIHHRPTINSAAQHEWLHTTDNHPQSSSSEEYDDDDDDDDEQDDIDEHDDIDQEPHFSPSFNINSSESTA